MQFFYVLGKNTPGIFWRFQLCKLEILKYESTHWGAYNHVFYVLRKYIVSTETCFIGFILPNCRTQ
jgi:hypothetical protein